MPGGLQTPLGSLAGSSRAASGSTKACRNAGQAEQGAASCEFESKVPNLPPLGALDPTSILAPAAGTQNGLGWQVWSESSRRPGELPGAAPANRSHPTCARAGKGGGEEHAGHCSLTWAPASSVCHACARSGLPGALLRGLGLAGCGVSPSARAGGGGTPKWVGGKTSPPSHHEGAAARWLRGAEPRRARRPGATCPPACPLPTWPERRAAGRGAPAGSPQARSRCKARTPSESRTTVLFLLP
jgi:hypothetical protein